jgi:hypothetical protein
VVEQHVNRAIATTHTTEQEMTKAQQLPETGNSRWGLFGTLGDHAPAAWPIAMTTISDATGEPLASVRLFLDSRHGRHFADDVLSRLHGGHALPDAIHATTRQWMNWKIGRQTSRQYGIPLGKPYLTGFVIHGEINEPSPAV